MNTQNSAKVSLPWKIKKSSVLYTTQVYGSFYNPKDE